MRAALGLALLLTLSNPGRAQELRVAAASDLTYALGELAPRFEKQSGIRLRVSYGSSGNLHAQIANGAPFDVFLSADGDYPRRLHGAGLAEAPVVYGRGRILLWARPGGLDVTRGMEVLLAARRIAIANPEHAPYGRAAIAALRHFGLYEKVRDRIVFGENISQAAQFAESGSADVGILALSLTLASPLKDRGTSWEIPADAYPRLDQAAAVLSASPRQPAARAFLAFLQTPAARDVLRRYGFEVGP